MANVTRLLRHDASAESRLTVVLALDPRRLPRLGRRVVDLVDLRIELEPWESADTWAYLQTILAKAGADPAVFEPSAAERLHELSGGIPRQITHLAELSLLAGAGADSRTSTPQPSNPSTENSAKAEIPPRAGCHWLSEPSRPSARRWPPNRCETSLGSLSQSHPSAPCPSPDLANHTMFARISGLDSRVGEIFPQ